MYAPKLRTWVSDKERRHKYIDAQFDALAKDVSKQFQALYSESFITEITNNVIDNNNFLGSLLHKRYYETQILPKCEPYKGISIYEWMMP